MKQNQAGQPSWGPRRPCAKAGPWHHRPCAQGQGRQASFGGMGPMGQAVRAAGFNPEMMQAWRQFRMQKRREMNQEHAQKVAERRAMWQKWRQYVQEQRAKEEAGPNADE